jgi:hypothetical protein
MKAFKDLQVGDTIFYYDHCQMKPRTIVKIETKDVTKELWGGGTRTYNYILLYCEHGYQPISVHTTWDHGNSTMIHHASTKYFSCKEAAEQWLKGLKGYRERRIERAKYLIEKETKILSKYKFND